MSKLSIRAAAVWLLACLASAGPAVAGEDPHRLVEETTDAVMVVIRDARDYHESDPQRFYGEVAVIMEDVVDFGSFARGVMGRYASKDRYVSLESAEEREHFKQQIREFIEVFKTSLIQTYAKGLLSFNGGEITVRPPEEAVTGNSAVVIQEVVSEDGSDHLLQYKLRKGRDGHWLLRNVIIDGINLGLTYRNQFASAARDYDGDIDRVIANWSVDAAAGVEQAREDADQQ